VASRPLPYKEGNMKRLTKFWDNLKIYYLRFSSNDEGILNTLELSLLAVAFVIFLAIAIPSLLSHIGGLFNKANTSLDGVTF